MSLLKKTAFEFDIELIGKYQVYLPGATVEGNVVLEASKVEKVRSIKIVFSGEARTYWTVAVTNATTARVYLYSDTEVLFQNQLLDLLTGDDHEYQVITAGVHRFPFQFKLPIDGCPSSFQSKAIGEGSIRYWLTAVIEQPMFKTTIERDVTINEIVDINKPQLLAPLSNSNEKTVCCLWCASGPISLSITTDRGGYCVGESIGISVKAKNSSKRRVTVVRASLKQKVTLYAKDMTFPHSAPAQRVEENVIQRIEGPGIEPGATCSWVNEPLHIPVTASPTINSCRIVKLSYSLTVTLVFHFAKDLHVRIPLVIGNKQPVSNNWKTPLIVCYD